jgi:hypothetical protein
MTAATYPYTPEWFDLIFKAGPALLLMAIVAGLAWWRG